MRLVLCVAAVLILMAPGCATRRAIDNDRLQAESEAAMAALSGASKRVHASGLDEAQVERASQKIRELWAGVVSLDVMRVAVVGERMEPRNAEKVESLLISVYVLVRSIAGFPPEALAREVDPEDESRVQLTRMLDEAARTVKESFR